VLLSSSARFELPRKPESAVVDVHGRMICGEAVQGTGHSRKLVRPINIAPLFCHRV
jgi:hypothetical protein